MCVRKHYLYAPSRCFVMLLTLFAVSSTFLSFTITLIRQQTTTIIGVAATLVTALCIIKFRIEWLFWVIFMGHVGWPCVVLCHLQGACASASNFISIYLSVLVAILFKQQLISGIHVTSSVCNKITHLFERCLQHAAYIIDVCIYPCLFIRWLSFCW